MSGQSNPVNWLAGVINSPELFALYIVIIQFVLSRGKLGRNKMMGGVVYLFVFKKNNFK